MVSLQKRALTRHRRRQKRKAYILENDQGWQTKKKEEGRKKEG